MVPPPIGRYYFLDLRPGRSFVEYAVSRGPADLHDQLAQPERGAGRLGPRHLRRARPDARSTRSARSPAVEDVNMIGFCAGGIINAAVLNHLAATGDDRVTRASFARDAARLRAVRPRSVRSPAPGCSSLARRELAARRGDHGQGDGQRRSPGCAPTTWSGTTGSTTT